MTSTEPTLVVGDGSARPGGSTGGDPATAPPSDPQHPSRVRGWVTGGSCLPRALHPAAWWAWALGLAVAVSRTTNPLLIALVIGVVAVVVTERRTEAPWARGLAGYLVLGLVVIGLRVGFRIVLGGTGGSHVLFTLPDVPLPEVAAGIRLGGRVTLEEILAAVYDGLRLAGMLLCVGAANLLADPKRLLKSVPAALHEAGVTITVALTLAPQIVDSTQRVRRSRHLRGAPDGHRHLVERVLVPVLEDALDRSMMLAAAMDSRGYGRTVGMARRDRLLAGSLIVTGLIGICIGTYGMLDGTAPRAVGMPALIGGVVIAAVGLGRGGRRVARSVYRPDPWERPEWAVVACGAVVAVGFLAWGPVDLDSLHPSLIPLRWPSLPPVPTLLVLVGALPAVLAPPVPREVTP